MLLTKRHIFVMPAIIFTCLLPVAVAIHGCGSSGTADGGANPDGSIPLDGGARPDGGVIPDGGVQDGGFTPDGGVTDGGVKTDGGVDTDASAADGGANPDGGLADGGTNPDGGASDGGTTPDGSTADGGGCTYYGLTVVEPETYYGKDSIYEKDYWMFIGASSSEYPLDTVDIEDWVGYGGPATTGVYAINANETAYATCGFCFIISQNCISAGNCEKYYMPMLGGTFNLINLGTAPGGTFSGSLSGVKFQEVKINWDTQETTPVPGGSTWCMDGFAWSGTILP